MRIIWTDRALIHIAEVGTYLEEHDPEASLRILNAIAGAVEALALHPRRGRPGRVPRTRELIVPHTPYLVAYRLRAAKVEILAVRHGARKWPKRL